MREAFFIALEQHTYSKNESLAVVLKKALCYIISIFFSESLASFTQSSCLCQHLPEGNPVIVSSGLGRSCRVVVLSVGVLTQPVS